MQGNPVHRAANHRCALAGAALLGALLCVTGCAVDGDAGRVDGTHTSAISVDEEGRLLALSAINPATGEKTDPAIAPLSIAACPDDYICFYDSGSTGGWTEADPVSFAAHKCYNLDPAINNLTSYIVNNTDAGWYVFDPTGCGGTAGYIYPHTAGFMGSPWNNSISSFYRLAIP